MAKEQQQILTEKFNASLQNNEALKAENAGSKPFYEVNIKQIYDKHVKTVVNEELKNTNPKEYEKQVAQRGKENVQALKEIYSVYKKPMLALLTIDEKMEDENRNDTVSVHSAWRVGLSLSHPDEPPNKKEKEQFLF